MPTRLRGTFPASRFPVSVTAPRRCCHTHVRTDASVRAQQLRALIAPSLRVAALRLCLRRGRHLQHCLLCSSLLSSLLSFLLCSSSLPSIFFFFYFSSLLLLFSPFLPSPLSLLLSFLLPLLPPLHPVLHALPLPLYPLPLLLLFLISSSPRSSFPPSSPASSPSSPLLCCLNHSNG